MQQVFNSLFGVEVKVKFRLPVFDCKKALILSPHPDDETLGCGGTIRLLREKGCSVSVALMTDGNDRSFGEDFSKVRIEEFNSATNLLECNKSIYLGFPDGKLSLNVSFAVEQLTKILEDEKPEIIFLPYILDFNPDHKFLNLILSMSLNKNSDVYIAMYEVWTPIVYPDCYVDITKDFNTKLTAISCYVSQENNYKIRDKTVLLNELRAKLSMRKSVNYIEAFKTFRSKEYCNMIGKLECMGWFEK